MYVPLCSDLRIRPIVVSSFTSICGPENGYKPQIEGCGGAGNGASAIHGRGGGRAGQQLCGPTHVRKSSPAGSQGGGSQGLWPSELLAEGYVKAWEACLGLPDQQGRGPGFAVLTLAPSWLLRRRARSRNS